MRAYVFLVKAPQDKQAWPVLYTDEMLAQKQVHRVSEVAVVEVPEFDDELAAQVVARFLIRSSL